MEQKSVTIIIPVYKDWTRLSLCLSALEKQSYAKDLFDIIIVNNDPDDFVPEDYFIPQNGLIINEIKPGSYAARNAGLNLARGEIVAFTDSDCIPHTDWIKNAIGHFNNNKSCSRIAGKVCIFFKNIRPTKAELYEKYYAFNQSKYVATWGTSVTANLFTYKHVFEHIGLFNENLMSGGDWSWGVSAQNAGYQIDFVTNVKVDHPARYSFSELIKKEKRIGGGQALFFKRGESTAGNFIKFLKTLWPNQREVKYIKQYCNDLSINNKVYFFLIRHYLLNIRAYERFRVQRGKKAKRN